MSVPDPFAGCGTMLGGFLGIVAAVAALGFAINFLRGLSASAWIGMLLVAGAVVVVSLVIRRGRRIERKQIETRRQQEAFAAEQQRAAYAEQQRVAHWQHLCSTFGEPAAQRIFAGRIWVGQGRNMLVASLGEPGTTKQRVLKTKTKEVWSYWPDENRRYRLKIDLEDNVVVGWETSDGTSAPSADPP